MPNLVVRKMTADGLHGICKHGDNLLDWASHIRKAREGETVELI